MTPVRHICKQEHIDLIKSDNKRTQSGSVEVLHHELQLACRCTALRVCEGGEHEGGVIAVRAARAQFRLEEFMHDLTDRKVLLVLAQDLA